MSNGCYGVDGNRNYGNYQYQNGSGVVVIIIKNEFKMCIGILVE